MKNISTLTDKDLLALCQKYGTQAILWKRKFIGLLPEVDRRKLYEKKKCVSIYEFAAKFGGVTKKHTQRVIQIDKAFEEKGVKILREILQEGAVSISKLIKVVSVVTVGNEPDIVFAVKNLSHESLETYVRDMRHAPERERRCFGGHDDKGNLLSDGLYDDNMMLLNHGAQIDSGFPEPSDCPKSVRPNTFADAVALKKLRLDLSAETLDELLELQGKGINIDILLKEFLQKRKENIAEKKEETVRKVTGRENAVAKAKNLSGKYLSKLNESLKRNTVQSAPSTDVTKRRRRFITRYRFQSTGVIHRIC